MHITPQIIILRQKNSNQGLIANIWSSRPTSIYVHPRRALVETRQCLPWIFYLEPELGLYFRQDS